MYSIDLNKITLKEFKEMLCSIELLPGRRILLNDIEMVVRSLESMGVNTLFEAQKILKKKINYTPLSKELGVKADYLKVLNREINSYESKPVAIDKISVFTKDEITRLSKHKIRNTKDIYENASTKEARKHLSNATKIPGIKLLEALKRIDLLRVNGIGPVYAEILIAIGINSKDEYLSTRSDDILAKYRAYNDRTSSTKVTLGIKDIEYCKKFCLKLSSDIEW